MEESQDSGIDSSFHTSGSLFESTPRTLNESVTNPKKRKLRKFESLDTSYPLTPRFCSTLNESLADKFEDISIDQNYYTADEESECKYLKDECAAKIPTSITPRKAVSFSIASPLKEQHDILYPNLKPLKPLTPQKFKEKLSPAKKVLFRAKNHKAFDEMISNDVIMTKLFTHLSDGDLFRTSLVSKRFKEALYRDLMASYRLERYKKMHKVNKENYRITPRNSPESDHQSLGSDSPRTKNFKDFVEIGSKITNEQSLMNCLKCRGPAVVDNSVAQCQRDSCGYIFCQKCFSSSYRAEDFNDKCQNSQLVAPDGVTLLDLSNSPFQSRRWSLNVPSKAEAQGSVKRNLNRSFGCVSAESTQQRALFERNRVVTSRIREQKRQSPFFKVIPGDKKAEQTEPPSPPRAKPYTIGSKQSKKNLKRLLI